MDRHAKIANIIAEFLKEQCHKKDLMDCLDFFMYTDLHQSCKKIFIFKMSVLRPVRTCPKHPKCLILELLIFQNNVWVTYCNVWVLKTQKNSEKLQNLCKCKFNHDIFHSFSWSFLLHFYLALLPKEFGFWEIRDYFATTFWRIMVFARDF